MPGSTAGKMPAATESMFAHLGAGSFEDPALALGQALDAVGGDLVENRVHLTADEIGRGQVVNGLGVFLSPERASG